jgi:hypothetical protein
MLDQLLSLINSADPAAVNPGIALPKDGLDPALFQQVMGAANSPMLSGSLRKPNTEGIIADVNEKTHSYKVQVNKGEAPLTCFRMMQSEGEIKLLPTGTRVAISFDYSQPAIIGVIPHTTPATDNTDTSVTGETSTIDPSNANQAGGNFRPQQTPSDMSEGDEGIVSPDGNFVGALAGGVNLMKSGGLASVMTSLVNDLVQVTCGNYRMQSNMGVSEIKNDGGRVSYTFRGGSDQKTECGSDQDNWSIRLDLGAEGDLFRFALTNPDGGRLFEVHVNADGKIEAFGADGLDMFSGANTHEKTLGSKTVSVKRDVDVAIGGEVTEAIASNRETAIGGSDTKAVGNDIVNTARRNRTESTGGQHIETVTGGNPLTATPLNVARETNIVNGSWEVSIGDPLNGANVAALAGFLLQTFSGDIEMAVKTLGNVKFSTKAGNAELSTILGNATLKTTAGIANVDGTTVLLGNKFVAPLNPILKGTVHNAGMMAYTGANIAGYSAATAATSALIGVLANPVGLVLWGIGPVMVPIFLVWLGAITAMLSALLAANSALAAALTPMLSTTSFTA